LLLWFVHKHLQTACPDIIPTNTILLALMSRDHALIRDIIDVFKV